jgi:hypothetical protein
VRHLDLVPVIGQVGAEVPDHRAERGAREGLPQRQPIALAGIDAHRHREDAIRPRRILDRAVRRRCRDRPRAHLLHLLLVAAPRPLRHGGSALDALVVVAEADDQGVGHLDRADAGGVADRGTAKV